MAEFSIASGLIAAALASGSGGAGSAAAPVHLVTEPVANGVRITVVGKSASAVDATYALEVSSNPAAGGNRSTQRGSVRLRPGVPVTMVTLTLGGGQGGGWTARLKVEPKGAPAYEEVKTSS